MLVFVFHSQSTSVVFLVVPSSRHNLNIALIKPQAFFSAFWDSVGKVLRPQVFCTDKFCTFFACFFIDMLCDDLSVHFLLSGNLFEEFEFSSRLAFVGESFFGFLFRLLHFRDVVELVMESLFGLLLHWLFF